MFWKYMLKRVFYGIFIYIILIFVFSALFNTVMEQTLRGQIDEEIRAELMALDNVGSQQIQNFIEMRRAEKFALYKLDKPIFERIVWRTWSTLTLNLGKSSSIRSAAGDRNVWAIVSEKIPRTLILFSSAMLIDIIIGIWLGLKKAQKAGGVLDKSTSVGTMVVFGMPSWWLGMILIMFFAYTIKVFPSGGLHATPPPEGIAFFLDALYHLALPVMTLVVIGFWGRAFLTRNIVLGVLQDDYIMAARARGIPERKVLYGHTMRTSAPPIVTMSLLALLASVSGNIVFEGIFNWPGMGNLFWFALQQNDVPVLMGNLAITTGLYICGLVLLDLVYGLLDPRIKVGGKA
ncbi:MAG: ABC transporter permease [Mesotoga sp.]|uniref:ABC transporter permease n=1 Tax=Mesotoga sp. TaxID=2053577 RepID=UPI0016B59D2E|nr:ABC transporter permease [Mesotoga sp.]MDI9367438.1 ABC transporter permease [Thermotogota bacterium]NLT44401.1 ABC transporter permease [Thermotogaceae bacterium]MDD3681277.1 ABC transporter permease [Mesotoga sp.]MDD4207902.1 ABC transporter permease [Mesotoga sp.]MDD5682839.1 ABC transporter permease [Mesotoga sp.]